MKTSGNQIADDQLKSSVLDSHTEEFKVIASKLSVSILPVSKAPSDEAFIWLNASLSEISAMTIIQTKKRFSGPFSFQINRNYQEMRFSCE